jgi:hypothetical protein
LVFSRGTGVLARWRNQFGFLFGKNFDHDYLATFGALHSASPRRRSDLDRGATSRAYRLTAFGRAAPLDHRALGGRLGFAGFRPAQIVYLLDGQSRSPHTGGPPRGRRFHRFPAFGRMSPSRPVRPPWDDRPGSTFLASDRTPFATRIGPDPYSAA